jgi:hypothetical protein
MDLVTPPTSPKHTSYQSHAPSADNLLLPVEGELITEVLMNAQAQAFLST